MTCFPVTCLCAQSVTIKCGTVDNVQTISKACQHAGCAIAGGVIGALVGPRSHRDVRVLANAETDEAIIMAAKKVRILCED